MTLLAVERIKLFSTRSPWWCMAAAVALVVGFGALLTLAIGTDGDPPISAGVAVMGNGFGLVLMMVMAALAVTTEYRFGTMRPTFLAIPRRTPALLAKTAVVATVAGVVGSLTALAAWGLAYVMQPGAALALGTEQEYRIVLGMGLYWMFAAVTAVAIALLVRQTAAALAIIFTWVFVVESLIPVIPSVGETVGLWLPFLNAGANFLWGGLPEGEIGTPLPGEMPFSPWGSLLYFAGIAVALLVAALVTTKRRDA